jgi:succinate-acetate transporter protein
VSAPQHDQLARIFLRPLGNPLPLGFIGLAGATIALSGLQLHWVHTAESPQVGIVLIFFAAPAQLIASVLAFLSRDAPTAAGMGVQAATWLTAGVVLLTSPPGSRSQVLGLLLFAAAAGVLVAAISASLGKVVAAAVLATTALRFLVSGVYQYTGASGWRDAAGWVGVVLCALALYAALGMSLEDSQHRTVLPLLRRRRGKRAVSEGMMGADHDLEREPGVREQL